MSMRRDYKNQGRSRKKKKAAPAWGAVLLGGVAGSLVTATLMIWVPGARDYVAAYLPQVPEPTAREERVQQRERISPPKPRFDFYSILPEMEVVVPDQEASGATGKDIRRVEKPGTYILQVGSFRERSQADSLKAQLILLGLGVSVQEVRIDNNRTWFRVRVGPYRDLAGLNADRARLRSNGHDAVVIRLKS